MDKTMNIKLKFMFTCLFLSILSSSEIPASAIIKIPVNSDIYSPITEYQNSLSKMITTFIHKYLYKKAQTKNNISMNAPIIITTPMSRDEALNAIKEETTKLFDINNAEHLSVHLLTMKDLSKNLDQELDKKTINAIHFLLENQHRSGLLDRLFWMKAVKEKELETAIPMTPEVTNKPKAEKLAALLKKITMPINQK
jgi:hypothetical protein